MTYEFSTGLFSSPVARHCPKRHRTEMEPVLDVLARSFVWRQGNEYTRLENCDAAWARYRRSIRGIGQGSFAPPIEVPDILDVDLLFKQDSGWTC